MKIPRDEQSHSKLIDYFKKNLKKGYTVESLKWALVGQGYSRVAVERAIDQVHKEMARQAPILKEKPLIRHEIIDENDMPVYIKKPWWKKLLGL